MTRKIALGTVAMLSLVFLTSSATPQSGKPAAIQTNAISALEQRVSALEINVETSDVEISALKDQIAALKEQKDKVGRYQIAATSYVTDVPGVAYKTVFRIDTATGFVCQLILPGSSQGGETMGSGLPICAEQLTVSPPSNQ